MMKKYMCIHAYTYVYMCIHGYTYAYMGIHDEKMCVCTHDEKVLNDNRIEEINWMDSFVSADITAQKAWNSYHECRHLHLVTVQFFHY